MKLWQKFSASLVALATTFGGGFWCGYTPPKDCELVDPQEQISTVFTPQEDGLKAYLNFLDKANTEIYIACYGFTEPKIVDKLIELKNTRGITVRILLDRTQSAGPYQKAQIARLLEAGIEVTIGTSEKYGQIMHNKFTVIDGIWVEDGSWNYSQSASKQANVLNFVRSEARAAKFQENWQRMYLFMSKQKPKSG